MSSAAARDGRRPRLAGGWQLWRTSISEFRRHWWLYLSVVLVVVLPLRAIDAATNATATQPAFAAYSTVASLVMNLALLAVCRWRLAGEPASLRRAYFEGTTSIVRFALASIVLAFCFIPALIGTYIIVLGVNVGGSVAELIIVGLLGALVAAISFWLFVRFCFGPIIGAGSSEGPLASLATARRLTLGRFWTVAGRLATLVAWLVLVAAICFGIVTLIGLGMHNETLLANLFQFLLSLSALPLASIYLTRLHASLAVTS